MPLGQRRPVSAHQQRQMAIGRRSQAQRLEHQQLPRRVGQVIFAAQHVRDVHLGIVDGVAEEERRAAVGAPQDEIADVIRGEALRSVHHVVELDHATVGHAKARGRRDALRALAHPRLGGQLAAGARITRRPAGGELRLAGQIELQRRAVAGIGEPTRIQRGRMARVDRSTARLVVLLTRGGGPLFHGRRWSRIPFEPHPAQIVHQRRGVELLAALGVRILDAQDEATAVVACEQPAEQRGTRVAEVQLAGGTGSESCGDAAVKHRRSLRESNRAPQLR